MSQRADEVRGVRARRVRRRAARRARRAHAARGGAHAGARRAGRARRGRPRRGHPAGPAAGQRRRQHEHPRLRPRGAPHRPGARSRPPPSACASRPTRSPTGATSSPSAHDGTMVDFAGGHPSTEDAAEVIGALDAELGGDGISFHPGVQYRHIMVAPAELGRRRVRAAPRPVRQAGGVAHRSGRRPSSPTLMDAIAGGRRRLAARRQPGLALGPGPPAAAAVVPRGATASRPASSPRSTSSAASACSPAWTSSRSRARPAGTTPTTRASGTPRSPRWPTATDLFVIHVEATDEAGHAGNLDEKVAALENWDRRILAGPRRGARRHGPVAAAAAARPPHAGARSRPTPPTRCRTCWSTRPTDGPGGIYTEPGDRGLRAGARPRADGPSSRRPPVRG